MTHEEPSHGHGRARDSVHAAGRHAHHRLRRGGTDDGGRFVGILLIALGAIFLLSNLELINLRITFRTIWPLALVAWGVHQILTCRGTGRVFGIGLTAFGSLLFLNRLFGWDIDMWALFWPAMLILFGVHLSMHGRREDTGRWHAGAAAAAAVPPPIPYASAEGVARDPGDTSAAAPPGTDDRVDSSATFRELAVLGNIERRNVSQTFRGGEVTAIMGAVEIDLRECRMAGNEAYVDLLAIMGGVELRIPKGWAVESRMSALLAGLDDRSEPPVVPGAPRLVLRGTAFLGGIEIRN